MFYDAAVHEQIMMMVPEQIMITFTINNHAFSCILRIFVWSKLVSDFQLVNPIFVCMWPRNIMSRKKLVNLILAWGRAVESYLWRFSSSKTANSRVFCRHTHPHTYRRTQTLNPPLRSRAPGNKLVCPAALSELALICTRNSCKSSVVSLACQTSSSVVGVGPRIASNRESTS